MFGKKGSAPKPPSAQETYAAQMGSNIGTSIANANLGFVNQTTPAGSLTYDQTGTYEYKDPVSGETYDIPKFTATTQMSPEALQLYQTGQQTDQTLANLGQSQAQALGQHMSQPFQLGQANYTNPTLQNQIPSAGPIRSNLANPSTPIKSEIDYAGSVQNSFDKGGDITRTYGADDFSSDRKRVEDTLMQRMEPQIQQDRDRLRTQLVNQGFREGSEGYDRAFDNLERQIGDTRMGAILSAGQEQSRLTGMDAARAGFQNQAQQQGYTQNLGQGAFANQAQAQQFGVNSANAAFQNSARGQEFGEQAAGSEFYNTAQGQQFGQNATNTDFTNQVGQQQLSNDMTIQNWLDSRNLQNRNQPINEISALMSGSQVAPPQFNIAAAPQIANTDYAQLAQNEYQGKYNNYMNQQQSQQQMLGAILGLGGKAIGGF